MDDFLSKPTSYRADLGRLLTDIEDCLAEVEKGGDFACSTIIEKDINPGLIIDDLGLIGLPLSEREARVIIEASREAEGGKGGETNTDEAVSKTWEVDAEKVGFKNPKWEPTVASLVQSVVTDLGAGKEVKGELYKLLIYGKGAMVKPHTE